MADIQQNNELYAEKSDILRKIKAEVAKVVVGQDYLVDRLLIALVCNQHVLIEGVPGIAKTLTVNTMAKTLSADFKRVQFTPDLLPSDLLGTMIFNPKSGDFSIRKGPAFTQILLADEINRAPAKVQSALLECMAERQITLGDTTHALGKPFMVLATQNPIDQEGTYPLPEAQTDRFMMKLKVTYPDHQQELAVLELMAKTGLIYEVEKVASVQDIAGLSMLADTVYMDMGIKKYIVDLVCATRSPEDFGLKIKNWISYGASPRATISLAMAAKAHALLHGRSWAGPEDVKAIIHDVLRHRIIVSYEAMAEGINSEAIVDILLKEIPLK